MNPEKLFDPPVELLEKEIENFKHEWMNKKYFARYKHIYIFLVFYR